MNKESSRTAFIRHGVSSIKGMYQYSHQLNLKVMLYIVCATIPNDMTWLSIGVCSITEQALSSDSFWSFSGLIKISNNLYDFSGLFQSTTDSYIWINVNLTINVNWSIYILDIWSRVEFLCSLRQEIFAPKQSLSQMTEHAQISSQTVLTGGLR